MKICYNLLNCTRRSMEGMEAPLHGLKRMWILDSILYKILLDRHGHWTIISAENWTAARYDAASPKNEAYSDHHRPAPSLHFMNLSNSKGGRFSHSVSIPLLELSLNSHTWKSCLEPWQTLYLDLFISCWRFQTMEQCCNTFENLAYDNGRKHTVGPLNHFIHPLWWA